MLQLLTAATGTNSPPSGATAGVSLKNKTHGKAPNFRWSHYPSGVIHVQSTAGSGTMTVTLRLWGYSAATSTWIPLGSNATMATRGVLNQGNAITEDGTDNLCHAEPVTGLGSFTRVYLEVVAIGGTSTAVSAYLVEDGGY